MDQQRVEPPPAICQRYKSDAIPTERGHLDLRPNTRFWKRLLCSGCDEFSGGEVRVLTSDFTR